MSTFPPRTINFPASTSASSVLLYGNASLGAFSSSSTEIQLVPGTQYQAGAAYLADPWPMSAFGRYGSFDLNMTVLIDEQIFAGADGIAFIFRAGDKPKSATDGKPDMLFYGGQSPSGGSWTIHFDTYQNIPVWNEPGNDFVAVYKDQNNVYDNRLCSRTQPNPPPIPFQNNPLSLRISLLGPGLLTPGSTNNVPDPSKQSRLRVSYWNADDVEPSIPLMECGVDMSDVFKQGSQGVEGREVWVGLTSLTGESANRHLVQKAEIKYCDKPNSSPSNAFIDTCQCNPNATLSNGNCLTTTSSSSSPLSLGAIIGIAVGGGVALILLVGGLIWYFRKKRVEDDGFSGKELGSTAMTKNSTKNSTTGTKTSGFQVEPTPPPTDNYPNLASTTTAMSTAPVLVATTTTAAEMSQTYPTQKTVSTQGSYPPPVGPGPDIPFNTSTTLTTNPGLAFPHGTELVVVMPYLPTQDDELVLNRGDRVMVEQAFDDGWAVGTNTTTRATGHFPLAATIKASEIS